MYAKDDAEFDRIVSQMRADCDAYGEAKWCSQQATAKFAMQQEEAALVS